MIAQTKAERLAIIKVRKREQKKRQLRLWWNKDAKPIVVQALVAILFFSCFGMMLWGCALDSENFELVFKGFTISAAAALIDAIMLWLLGGMEL